MAATVKTLIENKGELYWGTRHANPGYHYGIALDVVENGLVARLVYIMSDLDDNDEPLVTPDTLVSCYTIDDLAKNDIAISDLMDDDQSDYAKGWYCVEESFFNKDDVELLQQSNELLDGYLNTVLAIMTISAEEIAAGMPTLDEVTFFDLLGELEGIAERIDRGDLKKPLPFAFKLIGDALLGWEFADEADYR